MAMAELDDANTGGFPRAQVSTCCYHEVPLLGPGMCLHLIVQPRLNPFLYRRLNFLLCKVEGG